MANREQVITLLVVLMVLVAGASAFYGFKYGRKSAYREVYHFSYECKLEGNMLDFYMEDGIYQVRCINVMLGGNITTEVEDDTFPKLSLPVVMV